MRVRPWTTSRESGTGSGVKSGRRTGSIVPAASRGEYARRQARDAHRDSRRPALALRSARDQRTDRRSPVPHPPRGAVLPGLRRAAALRRVSRRQDGRSRLRHDGHRAQAPNAVPVRDSSDPVPAPERRRLCHPGDGAEPSGRQAGSHRLRSPHRWATRRRLQPAHSIAGRMDGSRCGPPALQAA